jgi:3-deoxy-manno-octulosonate cytidylyltransferase (CMP-KDO synthetase)
MISPAQVVGIIPARWASTRFPGKLATPILGRPLLAWVIEGCKRSKRVGQWIVATDDKRLAEIARDAGATAEMTSPHLRSGSDRVAKVAGKVKQRWIVNWQADEWLRDGRPIDLLLAALESAPGEGAATLCRPMSEKEAIDPNRVKVVVSQSGRALYFSRAAIPHDTSGTRPTRLHLGAYAFDRKTLLQFAGWRQTPLEKQERLEQLRLLEHDVPIMVAECRIATYGVDTPADAEELNSRLERDRPSRRGRKP